MQQQTSISINNRLYFLMSLIIIAAIIICTRLVYLQIIASDNFFVMSQKNFLRTEYIASPRGNILDHTGRLLATNRPVTSLYWQGTGNRTLSEEQQIIIETIQQITNKKFESNLLTTLKNTERTGKRIVLCHDLNFEQLSKILELLSNNSNIVIMTHFKRFYPYQKLASHILGYIHTINTQVIGKMGLEKILEDNLRGQPGKKLNIINSIGTSIEEQELCKALSGDNCVTTLELDIQLIAESIFGPDQQGSLLIMDPSNGALRAVISRPHFDPSTFLNPISSDSWQQLQEGQPFLNRAFNTCYPPASIFKLITISAALEHHIITPETITYCRGYLRFKGRPYHCSRKEGHGSLSSLEAVAQSCNIIFFEIAKRLSIDVLADYAQRFGLGQKTHILFPEQTGLIPTNAWKLSTKGERWWPGETLSAAIGQSYLLATPLQIACMIASIFEGYLVTPRILESEPIRKQILRLLPSTREFLKQSMKQATIEGTARKIGNIRDINVYAKTGTGQTCALEKRDLGKNFLEHAWCVAYFNYKNEKPLVLVMFVEHEGSSRVATEMAKKFFLQYRDLMEKSEKN